MGGVARLPIGGQQQLGAALGFGLDVNAWLEAFPPLYALSSDPNYGGTAFGELVQWLVVIDIAAVGLGTATGSSRGLFALARDGAETCVQVFFVRGTVVADTDWFLLDGAQDASDAEALSAFLAQFIESATYVPRQILLSQAPADLDQLQAMLRERRGGAVEVRVTPRIDRDRLVAEGTGEAREVERMRPLAALASGAHLEIVPACGHLAPLEAPSAVVDLKPLALSEARGKGSRYCIRAISSLIFSFCRLSSVTWTWSGSGRWASSSIPCSSSA